MASQANNLYDVVIIGGGPAGLSAALYLARAKYRVIVVEKEHFGGQITITEEIVNYPGIVQSEGKTLTDNMLKQAQNFGAEFLLAEVHDLDMSSDIKKVSTSRGVLECFGVLLATGAHPRKTGFKGEKEFQGRGVAYCATCDGEFFTNKEVFVIGGGYAAAEESVFLTKYASHVTVLIRGEGFTCAAATAEKALRHDKITVLTNVEVIEASGKDKLNSISYRNTKTGEITTYTANDNIGIFVFAGYEPETALVKNLADLDEQGYVITDRNQQTSCKGLYAAGDVCIKALRQVVTAVADGAIAATELEKYAAEMQQKTGLIPKVPAADTVKTDNTSQSSIFTDEILQQLQGVFARMENNLVLKLQLNKSDLSEELSAYITQLCSLTDKLTCIKNYTENEPAPCVKICTADGTWTGASFYGVPGGHEFTSFVLALYNAAGPGQALDSELSAKIHSLKQPVSLKVLISLSCTMCPELVTAAQRLAVENEHITAEVYDINHFSELKEQYNVMSVPCLVINNGEKILFGKKNLAQLTELLIEIQ